MRQIPREMRLSLMATCCGLALAGCGGGGSSDQGEAQGISLAYPAAGTMLVGQQFDLSAVADSGLPVAVESQTQSVCTISGNHVQLLAAGQCLLVATQNGGKDSHGVIWSAAFPVSQLFNVSKWPQQVTFVPPEYVSSATTSEIDLTATASTGLPVTFALDADTKPATCTLNGSKLTFTGKGSCGVIATQAGTDYYKSSQTARFIAVDPLLIADGFTPSGRTAGQGNAGSVMTKQNGAVSVGLWDVWTDNGNGWGIGWESCNDTAPDWCYHNVSDDGKTLTAAIRALPSWNPFWGNGFNRVEIFAPGLSAFSSSGDTTSGLRVTTETAMGFSLGVNVGLRMTSKPILVTLDLGKRNGSCNVQLTAPLFPTGDGVISYSKPLSDFAVTESCGLKDAAGNDLAKVGEGDLYGLPNPMADRAAFDAAWDTDTQKSARTAAASLITASDIVRVRFRAQDVNHANLEPNAAPVIKSPDLAIGTPLYSTEITVSGSIKIQ